MLVARYRSGLEAAAVGLQLRVLRIQAAGLEQDSPADDDGDGEHAREVLACERQTAVFERAQRRHRAFAAMPTRQWPFAQQQQVRSEGARRGWRAELELARAHKAVDDAKVQVEEEEGAFVPDAQAVGVAAAVAAVAAAAAVAQVEVAALEVQVALGARAQRLTSTLPWVRKIRRGVTVRLSQRVHIDSSAASRFC